MSETKAEAKPVIELENITVNYQSHTALSNINLTVPSGSFLAVVGPNGSGKTTLLKTLLGTIRPARGTVKVFGRPPWDLGEERRRIGYVPQASSVDLRFPIQVAEVVLMGRYGRIGLIRRPSSGDRKAALQAMQRVGIADLANEPIGRLSGGQRQRVFVARALANNPDLLLLDEPTTGVDIAASGFFYDLLYKLHKEGLTVVVVSHDMGVVANYADTVACINQCMVVHGRPGEVATGEVLACMYGPRAAFLDHGPVPHMVVPEHDHPDTETEKEHHD